ncbi:ornithine cyclodeaminase [Pelistega europaea]|uniref:Ornithine cyclodeaminase n=1 Tax=Pelistega europaea TaxID=106147 RepID=A0A7Y4LAG4_9BURK|nr:ornithine cyclodeaminase [Pelistega europaea]NOL48906.1 ornithine cyclodeaminase [Pelistega europaea]
MLRAEQFVKGSLPTLLISPQDVAKIIKTQGFKATIDGMVEYMYQDYLRWDEFDKCARFGSLVDNGVLELMPIASPEQYSFKYVNCHPHNPNNGLSTVLAFGALMSNDNGKPEVISDFTLTTALRTASMSVLAARYLARPNSKRMAIIGNGCQSEFQALAFHHALGITELAVYDIDRAASEKLARNLANTDIKVEIFDSVAAAVKGADIVTTVTAEYSRAHILTKDMIEPGMHINAVGGDNLGKTELDPAILTMGDVYIEFEPQTRIEGEIQNMPEDFPVKYLFEVFKANKHVRKSDDEVTIFDSVGFALEDFSAIRYIADAAVQLGLVEPIAIVPDLADPKDLFGYIDLVTEEKEQPMLRRA